MIGLHDSSGLRLTLGNCRQKIPAQGAPAHNRAGSGPSAVQQRRTKKVGRKEPGRRVYDLADPEADRGAAGHLGPDARQLPVLDRPIIARAAFHAFLKMSCPWAIVTWYRHHRNRPGCAAWRTGAPGLFDPWPRSFEASPPSVNRSWTAGLAIALRASHRWTAPRRRRPTATP